MKIAVTSQNFRTVTPHAGRMRRFLVFQAGADGAPVEIDRLDLANGMAMHDVGDDVPHPLDAVDVVMSASCGDGFVRRMARRGIVAVTTGESDPLAAVKAYLAQHAAVGADAHRSGHRHGGCHGHPSAGPGAEHGCGHRHGEERHHEHQHRHRHQRGPHRSAGGVTP